jgi:hypothetical protein
MNRYYLSKYTIKDLANFAMLGLVMLLWSGSYAEAQVTSDQTNVSDQSVGACPLEDLRLRAKLEKFVFPKRDVIPIWAQTLKDTDPIPQMWAIYGRHDIKVLADPQDTAACTALNQQLQDYSAKKITTTNSDGTTYVDNAYDFAYYQAVDLYFAVIMFAPLRQPDDPNMIAARFTAFDVFITIYDENMNKINGYRY